jgi:hypothetical protein
MALKSTKSKALGASPTATALYRLSATVPRSRPIRVTIVKSSRCALFFSTLPEKPSRGKPALAKSSLRSALGQRSLPPARKLAAPGSRQGAWRHATTAALRQSSFHSWLVLAGGQQGALAARRLLTPCSSHLASREIPCRSKTVAGVHPCAIGFRGIKPFVSSLRSPLTFYSTSHGFGLPPVFIFSTAWD